ncbi:TPA: sulfite exporter TauE/SafE family protein [Photobacterium damselae]|uniref:Sulfite exporter TauE/SafE family protein n=2 Tax=Photobacterium damselae TaxID=38293 RepID=A0ACD3T641_PHODM|nr:sulfite exporter TauE/SafE family protein [Photobacterium damselae]EEZ41432.1 integral membrane protein [Photobacterium damselae subsp. damselae CIP 102761]EHA1080751.1 sulfite exporter TauE/SafE family protein [Photobacterium damselae]MCG3826736.1 sulfite exporter TauE/SafE family protein [Photobacterium damselae]MDC4168615.1 sulfite exporter TauE/SafE family protein [Photobacterium damselae]NVH52503.1 sulfite exporter TauE/SafE family protein [Photobacterium damselae subsp. damselae]
MSIFTLIQAGLLVGGAIFVFLLIQAWRRNRTQEAQTKIVPIGLIGGFANFCDTLGIGSFAIMTAGYKQFKLVDDKVLPGTLNCQSVLATVVQSLIFLTAVNVDAVTLVSLVIAACAGATVGAKLVSSWDRQLIRIVMSMALLIVAGLMLAGQLKLFPLGGTALGLTGWKLAIGIAGNFLFGALMTVGIGLYAPCMTMIYMLGMNPLAAFPVMMCSCAFLSFFSAGGFLVRDRVNTRAALVVAITGPIAVVIAAYLVKSLDMHLLAWLVTGVVLYTAISMYRSWSQDRKSTPEPIANL